MVWKPKEDGHNEPEAAFKQLVQQTDYIIAFTNDPEHDVWMALDSRYQLIEEIGTPYGFLAWLMNIYRKG